MTETVESLKKRALIAERTLQLIQEVVDDKTLQSAYALNTIATILETQPAPDELPDSFEVTAL